MTDRLAELQKIARTSRQSMKLDPDDDLQNPLLNTHENKVIQKIISIFDEFKENLRKVNENLAILDQMGETLIKTVDSKTEKQVNAAMKKIIKTNLDFFRKNKKLLEVIKTVALNPESEVVKNNKEFIEKNFTNLMEENNKTMKISLHKETEYESKMKTRITRELKAIDGNLQDENLEKIVDEDVKNVKKIVTNDLKLT